MFIRTVLLVVLMLTPVFSCFFFIFDYLNSGLILQLLLQKLNVILLVHNFDLHFFFADFSQLCGRLAIFVLFQGEFLSVKFIETKVLINKQHGPKRIQSKQNSKQNIETEASYWTVYNSFNFIMEAKNKEIGI